MFYTEYLLLKILDGAQKIEGRKKLQKTIHLLSFTNVDIPFKFQYHHYGPYSSQLQGEIDYLVQQGFIDEKLFNGTYVYEITEKGNHFLQQLDEHYSQNLYLDDDLIKSLNQQSSQFLEMVSTYAFLIDFEHSPDDALEKAKSLKPHLVSYADEAKKFFHGIIKVYHHN